MEEVLNTFKTKGLTLSSGTGVETIDLNIPKIPVIPKDNTDRNRTSPFPFTGNKFEFRAVGSSANCSAPMMVLNTIVAHQLIQFKLEVDVLVRSGETKHQAIISVLQRYIHESEHIVFNGDGYSKKWETEAHKRGLKNIKSTPEALQIFIHEQTLSMFSKHQILTEQEMHARYEILLEEYIKKMDIETLVIEELAHSHILPSAYDHLQKLTSIFQGLDKMKLLGVSNAIKDEVETITNLIASLKKELADMIQKREKAFTLPDAHSTARFISEEVKPCFDRIRSHADQMEKMLDQQVWRLPKYRELLFNR